MEEFENSFKGLRRIIFERKLHKKFSYVFSGSIVLILNLTFFFVKNDSIKHDYFEILKIYINTFLPAFITFCGFTMTAYSLVVGFLNYGVFKSTIEKWYKMKITEKNNSINASKNKLPKFSIYQNGIALFALAILILLLTVILFLVLKFIIELNIEIEMEHIDILNAFILLIATLLTNYCILLMFYNVVNIFTFSQSLNELVYYDELVKSSEKEQQ